MILQHQLSCSINITGRFPVSDSILNTGLQNTAIRQNRKSGGNQTFCVVLNKSSAFKRRQKHTGMNAIIVMVCAGILICKPSSKSRVTWSQTRPELTANRGAHATVEFVGVKA